MNNVLIKHIGRIKICTSYYPQGNMEKDIEVIGEMLKQTYSIHQKNVKDMKILKRFYDNKNTIDKDKQMRPDIDNYVEVPDVFRITRDLNGHICGDGVKFSDLTGTKEKELTEFNKCINNISFDSIYLKANKNASLYGVGYYYIQPNNDFDDVESPFLVESENVDPMNTYCVYNQDIIPKKIWAVWFNDIIDDKNDNLKYTKFTVWSDYAIYNFKKDGSKFTLIDKYALVSKKIPIIEVQRNEDRIGDSELALSIIQAKNMLFSNRVDDVQQVVDYVYLLYNLSLGDEDENGNKLDKKERMKEILKSRVIELETINPTIQPKVDILKNPLNQSEIQTLADYLDEVINIIVALPDRNSDSSGTSDTGIANDYKLGFRNLESYSDTVTVYIKRSLKELISAMLRIISNDKDYNILLKGLNISDVEIKPQRNKIFSLNDTANAYSTLRSAGLNDEDAIKITNVSQDIAETAKKNRAEKEEKENRQIALEKEKSKITQPVLEKTSE